MPFSTACMQETLKFCHVGEVEEEDEEQEEKTGDSWLNELNPSSQTVITGCMANVHLAKAEAGDR